MFTTLSPVSVSSSSHLYAWRSNGSSKEPSGLKNYGNTCFMNSVLQSLFHCRKFSEAMMQSRHRLECTVTECVECAIENCMIEMHGSSPTATAALIKLLPAISAGNLSFGRQEDAHEFFISLVTYIQHHELVIQSKKKQMAALFEGVLSSRICCFNCRKVSSKEDPSVDIALDISRSKSLHDAFTDFCEVERLSGDNSYNCSFCKTTSLAQKCLRLQSCPNILIIQLKRFTYDSTGKTTKLNHVVEFSECLDLQMFVYRENSKNGSSGSECFELKSVVVHIGSSIHSGHYISYVKHINDSGLRNWFKVDDMTVTQVPASEALGQAAYLLFYERISEKDYKLLLARQQFAVDKPFYGEVKPRSDVSVTLSSDVNPNHGSKGPFLQRSRPAIASVRYESSIPLSSSSNSPLNHMNRAMTNDFKQRRYSVPAPASRKATSLGVVDDLTAVVSTVNQIDMHSNPMKMTKAVLTSPGSDSKRKFTPGLSYDEYEDSSEEQFSYQNYYRRSAGADGDVVGNKKDATVSAGESSAPAAEVSSGSGVTPLNAMLSRHARLSDTSSPNKKRKSNAGESIDLFKTVKSDSVETSEQQQTIDMNNTSKKGVKKFKSEKSTTKDENILETGLRFLSSAFKSVRKSLIRLTSSKQAREDRKRRKMEKRTAAPPVSTSLKESEGTTFRLSTVQEIEREEEEEEEESSDTSGSEDLNENNQEEVEWDLSHDDDRVTAAAVVEEVKGSIAPVDTAADSPLGGREDVLNMSDIIFEEEDSRFYLGTEPSTPGISTPYIRHPNQLPPSALKTPHGDSALDLSYGSIYSAASFDGNQSFGMNTSSLSVHRAISEYRASQGVTEKTPVKPNSMNSLYTSSSALNTSGARVPLHSASYSPYSSSSNLRVYQANPSGVKSSRILTQLPPPSSASRRPVSALKAPPKDIPLWQQQLNYLQSQMKANSGESQINNQKDASVVVNKVLFENQDENS